MTDRELDDLLAGARSCDPAPSPQLMARVLADAMAAQPRADRHAPVRAAARRPGLWARISAVFGGGVGLAGAACGMAAGVWIGLSPPEAVLPLTSGLWPFAGAAGTAAEVVEMIPGFDTFWMEG
jgi:hypothetical protein